MSTGALRKTIIVLTAIGLCLAGYLTYVHYSGATPPCSIKGNPCSQVQKSRYSEFVGIPVALIGLIGYIAILASLLAPEDEKARFLTTVLSIGGFGFSAYLTYRELFTLEKICEWCVASALLMTVIMCLSIWRYLRGERLPTGAIVAPG
ncbi:MAG TPA: vitamin K epoxide reductase family protein [Solirubrobacteraceae bacterium]